MTQTHGYKTHKHPHTVTALTKKIVVFCSEQLATVTNTYKYAHTFFCKTHAQITFIHVCICIGIRNLNVFAVELGILTYAPFSQSSRTYLAG